MYSLPLLLGNPARVAGGAQQGRDEVPVKLVMSVVVSPDCAVYCFEGKLLFSSVAYENSAQT